MQIGKVLKVQQDTGYWFANKIFHYIIKERSEWGGRRDRKFLL